MNINYVCNECNERYCDDDAACDACRVATEALSESPEGTRVAMIFSISETTLRAYLPANYRIVGDFRFDNDRGDVGYVIAGMDNAGWTLDGYVLPRLASGLWFGNEVA